MYRMELALIIFWHFDDLYARFISTKLKK